MMSLLPKTKIERLLLAYLAGLACGILIFLGLGIDSLQGPTLDGAVVAVAWGIFAVLSFFFVRSLKIFFDLRSGAAAPIEEDSPKDKDNL